MRIHHLNCGTMEGAHVCGHPLVCHCLLIETPASGLVLVDSGFGVQDLQDPVPRLGFVFSKVLGRPKRDTGHSALAQVKERGFDPRDVRHIVLTHMDFDHVGGLVDFPEARVHVHRSEFEVAMKRPDVKSRLRYLPAMWAHQPKFETYSDLGEKWFGFESLTALRGLPPEILLIPTEGHTRGHSAVAIKTGNTWLLHAGDAYYDHREIHQDQRACTLALEIFQQLAVTDRKLRVQNQDRLRTLVRDNPEMKVVSAHNPIEFKNAL